MEKKKKTLCTICNKMIAGNSYKFQAHLYLHNAVKPRFQCRYCPKTYFRNDTYKKHHESHFGIVTKKNKTLHICDYCDRGFVNKRNLIMHLKIHDDSIYDLQSSFKCNACNTSYCERRLLEYHVRKVHFNLENKRSNLPEKKLNETWVESVNEGKACVEMTKVDNNVIIIKKCHVKNEQDNKFCKETPKREKTIIKAYITSSFANKSNSHYSKAICDYCKKEMLKKSLPSHIRERHLHLRKFKCDQCNLGFHRHYQLINHNCGTTRHRKKSRKITGKFLPQKQNF